ncbi:MAG: hypothetical protein K0Q72_233 [Armatimonadetes bacterium]|jgi:hypothetical protein|nr:hypothetical protein [Armatimonadota bacterium]
MMLSTLLAPRASEVAATPPVARDLVEWLRTGRLTLVDERKQVVPIEAWAGLPTEVKAKALADFDRVVRGNAKAAVLYLR